MKRLGLAIVGLALAISATAAEKVASGLNPGDSTPAFQVVDASGPNKGKQLCYV